MLRAAISIWLRAGRGHFPLGLEILMRGAVSVGERVRWLSLGLAFAALAVVPGSARANHGAPLQSLTQQNGDGTALAAGAMATSSTVQLTATSASETCGTTTDVYRIQIELQPLS